MKKLLSILAFALLILACFACNEEDQSLWGKYSTLRTENQAWLAEQQLRTNPDGTPYYTVLVPSWNPGAYILIHYFNDRKETEGNLSPLYTSTVDTRYNLHLYDGTAVDSSTNSTTPAPGIFRTVVRNTVMGWGMALCDMRCGDTAEVILPYHVAYGEQITGSMPPYSNLRFNIRLVDIPYYEAPPYE